MKCLRTVILFVWLLPCMAIANESANVITAEQWAIPRHGESVLKMPALSQIVRQWQKNTQQTIEISYPGGENGELWLMELKDWLIALGVSSAKIKSIAGSGAKDIIKLSVLSAGGVNK